MKSLNFKKLNLRNEDVLSRTEMKKILGGHSSSPECTDDACHGGGGGSSCWHDAEWTDWDCSLSQAEARQKQEQNGGNWCTESCCESCLAY